MKLKDLMNMYGEYEVPQELVDKFELFKKPKSKTIWNLAYNDLYNWINGEGDICSHHWCKDEIDLNIRKAGNAFVNYAEAVKEKERREVEVLLLKYGGRRWFKKAPSENYYIWLRQGGGIVISDTNPVLGTIYFDSREQAEKAIAEIGEARIKQALFEER